MKIWPVQRQAMPASAHALVDEALRTCRCDKAGPEIDAGEVLRRYGEDTLARVRGVMYDDVLGYEVDWSTHDLSAGGDEMGDWLREARPWLSEESITFMISYFTWNWR